MAALSVESLSTAGLSPQARALWAKTSSDDPSLWLSLPQHMLDSAGVASSLWDSWASPALKERIASLVRLTVEDASTLYVWLAGVHDIGKATKHFQWQLDERKDVDRTAFSQRVKDAGLPLRMNSYELALGRFPHPLASWAIVRRWLNDHRVRDTRAKPLAGILDAHHGFPSDPHLFERADLAIETYEPAWHSVHGELLDWMANVTDVLPVLSRFNTTLNADAQQLLTGLVIMADWIASNQDYFPLDLVLGQLERLNQGLDFDLTAAWTAEKFTLDQLDAHMRNRFDWPDEFLARPVQRAIAEVCASGSAPLLTIVEAPTGEGKTEAALLAAEILAARTGAGGVLVATPTMATADGLFTRTLNWSRHAAHSEGAQSLFLGHSKAQLNSAYRDLKRKSHTSIGIDENAETREPTGSVIASEWLSGRKRGLLSNFVVSTVDQVLMLALQSKHSMLRHVALANKIIVIDEIHSYDTYMSQYLHTALAWLARYRVPVILLSATLPAAQKRELVEAYRQELSHDPLPDFPDAYPLITAVTESTVESVPVEARKADIHAEVSLIEDSLELLVNKMESTLADGGCPLIICNTVARAQDAYRALKGIFPGEIELHHAAFMALDRARKEEDLRAKLGARSHRGQGRPHRRIVVATQVAEQSLDIDADLLITDIAPMDLIIQRIGRLHRHKRPDSDRPENLRKPQVWIRGVESVEDGTLEGGALAIYDNEVLLNTLALVKDRLVPDGFTRPDSVPELVQSAYTAEPDYIPHAWKELWEKAREKSAEEKQRASRKSRTFRIPAPKDATTLTRLFENQKSNVDTASGEAQGLAQVRDSDPSVEVIPILAYSEGYAPLAHLDAGTAVIPSDIEPPAHTAFALAAATVRLPSRMLRYGNAFDQVLTELEQMTPLGWAHSHWLKGQLALPLDPETLACTINGHQLCYSKELGLYITNQSDHTTVKDAR